MKDKNGVEIQLGDMLKFKEDRYTQALGIVKRFSLVCCDAAFVTICGGGGHGERMIKTTKSEIVSSEQTDHSPF